jgi:chaperonin cofactor prefoldin
MKEAIEKRIEELTAQGKQLENQIHMINGALNQCQWTLAELLKQEAPKAEETQ